MSIPSANALFPPLAAIAIGSKKQFPKIVSSLELTNAVKTESTISAALCIAFARYKYGFLRFITFCMFNPSIFSINVP